MRHDPITRFVLSLPRPFYYAMLVALACEWAWFSWKIALAFCE
jgi:hypothetical protein